VFKIFLLPILIIKFIIIILVFIGIGVVIGIHLKQDQVIDKLFKEYKTENIKEVKND